MRVPIALAIVATLAGCLASANAPLVALQPVGYAHVLGTCEDRHAAGACHELDVRVVNGGRLNLDARPAFFEARAPHGEWTVAAQALGGAIGPGGQGVLRLVFETAAPGPLLEVRYEGPWMDEPVAAEVPLPREE